MLLGSAENCACEDAQFSPEFDSKVIDMMPYTTLLVEESY